MPAPACTPGVGLGAAVPALLVASVDDACTLELRDGVLLETRDITAAPLLASDADAEAGFHTAFPVMANNGVMVPDVVNDGTARLFDTPFTYSALPPTASEYVVPPMVTGAAPATTPAAPACEL